VLFYCIKLQRKHLFHSVFSTLLRLLQVPNLLIAARIVLFVFITHAKFFACFRLSVSWELLKLKKIMFQHFFCFNFSKCYLCSKLTVWHLRKFVWIKRQKQTIYTIYTWWYTKITGIFNKFNMLSIKYSWELATGLSFKKTKIGLFGIYIW
jgi:hypothetical protein